MRKFLPIGSVVLLKGADKRLMVCGRAQLDANDRYFDYSGCLYPEGYLAANDMYLFNDEDIETVFFIGFQDPDELAFVSKLSEKLEEAGVK